MLRAILVGLCSCMWVGVANAQAGGVVFTDGNQLHGYCQGASRVPEFDRVACLAYARAVADLMAFQSVGPRRACIPSGVTAGQLSDVVKMWLEKHPADRHMAAIIPVADAYQSAWPCAR